MNRWTRIPKRRMRSGFPICVYLCSSVGEKKKFSMRVLARYAELLRRLAFEVELNHDRRLISHHPAVMSRFDGNRLRCSEFQRAAVGVPNMDLALGEKTNVRVLAQISAHDRFHVLRPIEPGRLDHPLHSARAGFHDVELHSPDGATLGARDGSHQRMRRRHASITLPGA